MRIIAVFLALAVSSAIADEPHPSSPKNYDQFVPTEVYGSFETACANGSQLILRGRVVVKNPVVIDRDTALTIHGTLGASLVPADSTQPIFVIKKCPYLNLSRIDIDSGLTVAQSTATNGNCPVILFSNAMPIRVEMSQVNFISGMVVINGPGRHVWQNVKSFTNAMTAACVIVNHADAAFYWIGAHSGMVGASIPFVSENMHHVWQKSGHVGIYGTLPTSGRGRGDYRFDSPSPKGCHMVAAVRSEGNNYGASEPGAKLSRLVYVPPNSGKVNVAVKASYLMEPVPTTFVEYNGSGTLWLIGNKCAGQTSIVEGNAPGATIVCYGNSLDTASTLVNVQLGTDGRLIDLGNRAKNGSSIPFTSPGNTFATYKNIPEPPIEKELPFVACPSVSDWQIGTLGLVSVKAFGARGDGKTDDTAALQKAFDTAGQGLFVPAGTYLINQPIVFHPSTSGWIAGEGAGKSVIKNIGDDSVMWCQSLAGYLIQGITFESSGQNQPNFISEKITSQNTFTTFFDCTFRGGLYGLSSANFINTGNCEQLMIARCRFENCYQALSVGYANSLGVLVRDCDFQDNAIAYRIGGPWSAAWQGQLHVLGARIRGTTQFETEPNKQHNAYLWGVDSDSKLIYKSGAPVYMFFDNCKYSGGLAGNPIMFNQGPLGPVFLHSKIQAGTIEFPSPTQGYAFKLYSDVGEWTASKAKAASVVKFFDSDESQSDTNIKPLDQSTGIILKSASLKIRKVVPQGPRCVNTGALNIFPDEFLGQYSVISDRGDYTKPGAGYALNFSAPKWVYLCSMNRGIPSGFDGWQKLDMVQSWSGNTDLIFCKRVAAGDLVIPAHDGVASDGSYGAPHMLIVSDSEIIHFVPNDLIDPKTIVISLGKTALNGPRCSDAYSLMSIPAELTGLDCVLMPRGDYTKPGSGYEFNAKQPVVVYLSASEKGPALLDSSWVKLNRNIAWGAGNAAYMDNLYVREFQPGPIAIPTNVGKAPGDSPNYGPPHLAIVATSHVLQDNPNDLMQLVEGSANHSTLSVSGPRLLAQYYFRSIPAQLLGAECFLPLGATPSATIPAPGFKVKALKDCFVYLGVADQSTTTGTPTIPPGWTKTTARTGWASKSSDSIYVRQVLAGDIVEIPVNDSKLGGTNYTIPNYCSASTISLFP